MDLPPAGPDARLPPFAATARRTLVVHGAPVELVFVPERQRREGRATRDRPALRRSRAAAIVADEALWVDERHVVTPNRYPFAPEQRILWPRAVQREADPGMWRLAGAWVDAVNGTALLNTIGAAATIARAHVHLLPERLPFLPALRTRPLRDPPIDPPPGAELVAAEVPFCLLGVRGPADARAEALLRLGEARLTAAANVVVQQHTAWLYPRRLETPAPHFPFALGAAEVWGRWCYSERAPFDAATAADLERALVLAGMEPLP
ncbi:MAG: hypothetical protein KF830_05365 [Planctomycetes bacterium]|nr:hypothetical protein [Planctomycetota bacterium]